MTVESLAEKLGVGSTSLSDWMVSNGLTIEDMDSDIYQEQAIVDLRGGGLATTNKAPTTGGGLATTTTNEAPIVSTKTKAKKEGGKLAKGQEKALTKSQAQAQEARQVQQSLNSTLTTQIQSFAANVADTLDTIDGLTHRAGIEIADRLATADMVTAKVALQRLEEVAPTTGVSFSELDGLVKAATSSFG